MFSSSSFVAYLNNLKQNFQPEKKQAVVLGNQSADTDSIVSSLIEAWTLNTQTPTIPIINIPRTLFTLRRDTIHLLELVGITPDNLLFIEEFNSLISLKNLLSLHLVDHNTLSPDQHFLSPYIASIIDHHLTLQPILSPNTLIKEVGSTATLVTQNLLKELPAVDPAAALLLLETIYLDTHHLADHTTPDDQQAAALLLDAIKETTIDPYLLWKELFKRRHQIDHLSTLEILCKDDKIYQEGPLRYAIASLPYAVDWVKSLPLDIIESIKIYKNRHHITLLFILQTTAEGKTLIAYSQHLEILTTISTPLPFLIKQPNNRTSCLIYKLTTPLKRKELQPKLAHYLLNMVKRDNDHSSLGF